MLLLLLAGTGVTTPVDCLFDPDIFDSAIFDTCEEPPVTAQQGTIAVGVSGASLGRGISHGTTSHGSSGPRIGMGDT